MSDEKKGVPTGEDLDDFAERALAEIESTVEERAEALYRLHRHEAIESLEAELAGVKAKAEKWALAEASAIDANIRIGAELAGAIQELAAVKAERDRIVAAVCLVSDNLNCIEHGTNYEHKGVKWCREQLQAALRAPPVPEVVGAKLVPGATGDAWAALVDAGGLPEAQEQFEGAELPYCAIPARSLPPCDMPWGHEGDQHGNAGDGFYARDHDGEHHQRQAVRRHRESTAEVVGAKCPECKGAGGFVSTARGKGGQMSTECPVCHGTGQSQPSPAGAVALRGAPWLGLGSVTPVERHAFARGLCAAGRIVGWGFDGYEHLADLLFEHAEAVSPGIGETNVERNGTEAAEAAAHPIQPPGASRPEGPTEQALQGGRRTMAMGEPTVTQQAEPAGRSSDEEGAKGKAMPDDPSVCEFCWKYPCVCSPRKVGGKETK